MRPHPAPAPAHPTARQWDRSPAGVGGIVVCTGPAEHYRDNIHAALKLILVDDAPFDVRRRGTRYRAGPGTLLALHADDAHSGDPIADSGGPVADDYAPGWAVLCLEPEALGAAGVRGRLRFPEPVVDAPGLADRYRRLLGLLDGPEPALAKQAAVAGFVAGLARHGVATFAAEASRRTGAPAGTAAARDLLGDHLDRNVTLDELAAVSGLSTYQVVRAVRQAYGLPPHVLHLRLRLDRAQSLLRTGARPSDVAVATGFADQAHLTRSFKRLYGVTPGAYRRTTARASTPG